MIIDCHGHYTTAPNALEDWRNAQLFGSEMIGAVRGIDPETGHHCDNTRRNIDASNTLSAAEKASILEGNARRVYPRLDAALKHEGL